MQVLKKNLGFGLGLRTVHYQTILDSAPALDWLEIISENYLIPGGKPLYYLDRFAEQYPIVMHGVSMNIGSIDPLDWNYLKQLKNLMKRTNAKWLSDHLCWTGIQQQNMHDLLPLPLTEEMIMHVVKRLKCVQDYLGCRILIENPSTYIAFACDTLSEQSAMRIIVEEADALILLDINNVYVSAFNHGFDAMQYIQEIPKNRVQQIHLAGHSNYGDYIIDTHDATIIDPVWALYETAIQHFGPIPTMIERDDKIPPLEILMLELDHAKAIVKNTLRQAQEKEVAAC